MILRSRIAPDELPDEMAISAVTLAELSAGPHEVRRDTEQDTYFEAAERARYQARRPRRPGPGVSAALCLEGRAAHAGPRREIRQLNTAQSTRERGHISS
jgi:predicted nucleic acid-binding protein